MKLCNTLIFYAIKVFPIHKRNQIRPQINNFGDQLNSDGNTNKNGFAQQK